jgi:hypothetical protein
MKEHGLAFFIAVFLRQQRAESKKSLFASDDGNKAKRQHSKKENVKCT